MKKSKLFLIVLIIAIICGVTAYTIAYKPHKTIQEQKIEYSGNASSLLEKLQSNPEQWQNKIVSINGSVTSKDKNGIMFNNNTYCQFLNSKELLNVHNSDVITIKGRIIGYDDLLEELKLDQAIIYNK